MRIESQGLQLSCDLRGLNCFTGGGKHLCGAKKTYMEVRDEKQMAMVYLYGGSFSVLPSGPC
jgi:hypothetical protein